MAIINNGSRICNSTRVAQAAIDTNFVLANKTDIMIMALGLNINDDETEDQNHLWEWRRTGGTYATIGATGEVKRATGTDLVNDTTIPDADRRANTGGTYVESLKEFENGANPLASTGRLRIPDLSETQIAVSFADAIDNQEYEFRVTFTTDAGSPTLTLVAKPKTPVAGGTPVGRTFNLRHDIRTLIGRTFNLRHDVSAFVGRIFNVRHDIAQFVARTFNLRHDITILIGRTFNLRHDIEQLVGRTFALRHDIIAFVGRVFNIRYDIRTIIGRTFSIRHDIQILIGRAFNIRHDISAFIGRDFNVRHDISNFVNRTFNVRHDILILVGRAFNLRHDISEFVGRIFSLRHDIESVIGRSFNLRHDIAILTGRTFSLRHDISQFIGRTFNLRHDIILALTAGRTFNIRHDIRNLVGRIFNIRHDIYVSGPSVGGGGGTRIRRPKLVKEEVVIILDVQHVDLEPQIIDVEVVREPEQLQVIGINVVRIFDTFIPLENKRLDVDVSISFNSVNTTIKTIGINTNKERYDQSLY